MFYIDGVQVADHTFQNNAFLYGDAVKAHFFVRKTQLIIAEESYFFLMASMRKMRMNIPLSFTLEYFTEIFNKAISESHFQNGIIEILAYRNRAESFSAKTPIHYYFELKKNDDVLAIQSDIKHWNCIFF